MIKELVRKHLLEYVLTEAVPMGHFKERVDEVIDNIVSIQLPPNFYIPSVPKETQDAWIIGQIQSRIKAKIDEVISKEYPIGKGSKEGICVLVPLGMIKVQPLKGNPTNVLITAERKEGQITGLSYYVAIYDNRMPTLVLADPKIPANSSIGNQLQAHIKNTENSGWRINRNDSYIDKSFIDNIVISMANFGITN